VICRFALSTVGNVQAPLAALVSVTATGMILVAEYQHEAVHIQCCFPRNSIMMTERSADSRIKSLAVTIRRC